LGEVLKICKACKAENELSRTVCANCYSSFEDGADYEQDDQEGDEQPDVSEQELVWREKAQTIKVFTTLNPVSIEIDKELGIVFGNSSKLAFWGLSTQANRLSRAYEAALLNLKYDVAVMGGDAVIGVTFALNNSAGSSSGLPTGTSEAVMLIGTAVTTKSP
jgi:uncharacterized protein YbjQ (UPF0145 family)